MPQKRLPKQTLYAEVTERGKLNDQEQDGLIISMILVGDVWDYSFNGISFSGASALNYFLN